jgi:hypothetical protein
MKPRVPPQGEPMHSYNLSENLEWCVAVLFENEMISESRVGELLGLKGVEVRRQVLEDWTKRGWILNVWKNRDKELAKDLRKHSRKP